jgi:hypothetical protein
VEGHYQGTRGSSSRAKNEDTAKRISFARFSSRVTAAFGHSSGSSFLVSGTSLIARSRNSGGYFLGADMILILSGRRPSTTPGASQHGWAVPIANRAKWPDEIKEVGGSHTSQSSRGMSSIRGNEAFN